MAIYIQCDSIHAKGRRWIAVRPSSTPKEVVAETIELTTANPPPHPETQPPTGGTPPSPGGTPPQPPTGSPETPIARVALTQAQMPAYSHYFTGGTPPSPGGTPPQPTGSSPQETTV